ncbi:TetR/AcrR family transcriptional regulator [Nesterenkonia haasae]|uniref:TetR/AcrR family transcriptional regulator n=1 Tax=Nesterenkonia haasae TaxID=2587813 RepID=UPI001390EDD3|nr:TetR/AcrR family transcriptional regulator [Nesterenkonia haasae]NDK31562.1 TetR/AcrR family transcriptional regulator [Nesterenkonia haasae]
MPRAGLTTHTVIDTAARMLDEHGDDGLNTASLAELLGVKPPSLYKHIDGMAGLRRSIMLRAKAELAHELGQAAIGAAREEAVHCSAAAYRKWAKAHPGQYPLTMRAPVTGDPEDEHTSSVLVNTLYTILSGFRLEGDDLVDAARYFRSVLHGFVDLETTHAFQLPRDIDRSFTCAVHSVTSALAAWGSSTE